eukprot:12108-Heterococcus_DN1.PRE.1
MDWLLQQPGTELSRDVMSMAVWKGHAALCQYLYAQQCPWDDHSTGNAAAGGVTDKHSYSYRGARYCCCRQQACCSKVM